MLEKTAQNQLGSVLPECSKWKVELFLEWTQKTVCFSKDQWSFGFIHNSETSVIISNLNVFLNIDFVQTVKPILWIIADLILLALYLLLIINSLIFSAMHPRQTTIVIHKLRVIDSQRSWLFSYYAKRKRTRQTKTKKKQEVIHNHDHDTIAVKSLKYIGTAPWTKWKGSSYIWNECAQFNWIAKKWSSLIDYWI